jgi:hypothetical protein
MGALDFLKEFENRAIDAASYKLLERNFQMQDENNRLLKEKAELLQEENINLKADNHTLTTELHALKEKVAQGTEASKYTIQDGFAFRRKADESFEETPFCPNCYIVMGRPNYRTFICPKCRYEYTTRILPECIAQQLNSQHRGKV